MGAVILPIVGLLIMITLVTLFFSKKTIHTQETKLFKILLILNTIFIITGLVTFFVAKTYGIIEYIGILQRIYMSILTVLNCISIYYCIYKSGCDHESVTHKNAKMEYITVFQGELEMVVENRSYIVKSGEAIKFDATLHHKYINRKKL